MTTIAIKKATTKRELAECIQIRTLVFVVGQNVPPEMEVDEFEDVCQFWIALKDGSPVGTLRWRMANAGCAKVERVAVLETARGHGIATKLMAAAIDDIKTTTRAGLIKVGAQDYIMPLYEKLGFSAVGEGYMDGGIIPHHDMVLKIG